MLILEVEGFKKKKSYHKEQELYHLLFDLKTGDNGYHRDSKT